MKKLSLTLLAAATVAMGTVSFAVPMQASAAVQDVTGSTIAPEVNPGYYYKTYYFNSYPPSYYYDEYTEFSGSLRSVTAYPDGTYAGTYYGTDPYQ